MPSPFENDNLITPKTIYLWYIYKIELVFSEYQGLEVSGRLDYNQTELLRHMLGKKILVEKKNLLETKK